MENIIFQYIVWQFFDVPKEILKAWRNFLLFNLNYFSVSLLFKTLFSPWRRYSVAYGKGFEIGRHIEAFFSNLIFRFLGALVRTFIIILGLVIEAFLVLAGLIIFFEWLFLPAFLIAGLIFGFRVLI